MRYFLYSFFLLVISCSSPESPQSIIQKSILFHDPESLWNSLEANFTIELEMPDSSRRHSKVYINNSSGIFKLVEHTEQDTVIRFVQGDSCLILLNGSSDFSLEDKEKRRLTCERSGMYKDYYTYLYGLPMKLNDPGTIIDPEFKKVDFKGKGYMRVKATYEKSVGEDTWYFYFDSNTYAMEVYQFFHDEGKNDGEYILLEGLEEYKKMKIPKVRKWFTNKEDKFLGTDNLVDISNSL